VRALLVEEETRGQCTRACECEREIVVVRTDLLIHLRSGTRRTAVVDEEENKKMKENHLIPNFLHDLSDESEEEEFDLLAGGTFSPTLR